MPIPGLAITDDEIFPYLNLVLPAWLLLVFFPRWSKTQPITTAVALVFALLYSALVVPVFFVGSGGISFNDFNTLEGVRKALGSPEVGLAAWDHYVVFDLWAGKWIVSDAIQNGVPHLLVVPCLFGTLMLGPMGLLCYFVLRTVFGRGRVKAD